mmetsp:Transcript_9541/g.20231  ORF Transcript_9541/g.20231 Transcript_9541/m.20231 type:complete len:210 (+) Transcript_9541:233-862(+)
MITRLAIPTQTKNLHRLKFVTEKWSTLAVTPHVSTNQVASKSKKHFPTSFPFLKNTVSTPSSSHSDAFKLFLTKSSKSTMAIPMVAFPKTLLSKTLLTKSRLPARSSSENTLIINLCTSFGQEGRSLVWIVFVLGGFGSLDEGFGCERSDWGSQYIWRNVSRSDWNRSGVGTRLLHFSFLKVSWSILFSSRWRLSGCLSGKKKRPLMGL